jgi:hypothetical protein
MVEASVEIQETLDPLVRRLERSIRSVAAVEGEDRQERKSPCCSLTRRFGSLRTRKV